MASQSACSSLSYFKIKSCNKRFFLQRFCSTPGVFSRRNLTFQTISAEKALATELRYKKDKTFRLNRAGIVRASAKGFDSENPTGGKDGSELFPDMEEEGKLESFFWFRSDSVSSSEHAMEEEGKLESFSWAVYGALLASKLDLMTMRKHPRGFLAALIIEATMYCAGAATFLIISDRVLSPCLASGLRGYEPLVPFMKICLSLAFVYSTWPVVSINPLYVVAPFLASFVAQFLIGISPKFRALSRGPLVPSSELFEVCRICILVEVAHFLKQRLTACNGVSASNLWPRAFQVLPLGFIAVL